MLRLELPAGPGELLLWSHVCLIWTFVNYGHRLDPLTQADAARLEGAALRTWRWGVALRSVAGALVVAMLVGLQAASLGLGGLFVASSVLVPVARHRCMRARPGTWGRDLRAEGELAANVLFLVGAAVLVGVGQMELNATIFELAAAPAAIASSLVVLAGALFLLRGGTHVVRGVLEKTDTLPEKLASLEDDDLRHGVTIGNIERLLIYLFALAGSHAAIGLVIAAKGIVRAVEWEDRALVEYFLIGTLASAGLAAAIGIGVRWLLSM